MEFFSLISFSDLSLLMYRTIIDFGVLILYPATLPNSLISSHRLMVVSLVFYMCSIRPSENKDSFAYSFPICIPFIFFLPDHHG